MNFLNIYEGMKCHNISQPKKELELVQKKEN